MKRIFLLNLILAAFALVSCEGFLDVKPAGKLIPQTGDVASFDKLLNNKNTIDWIFCNNNKTGTLQMLTDDIRMSDNQANYGWHNGHPNIDCYYAYIFQMPYGNPATQDYYWNWGFYRSSQYFNSCIDGVKGVMTSATEKAAKETIAQATIGRAWNYFTASIGYGPVYKPNGDNSRKVLPYRTQSNVTAPMEDLSTLEEIYTRVLSDIHSVLPDVPERASSNTRFGKVQTYAFLAYYHLFTAKYDSVAIYADKALQLAASQEGGMENLFYDYNKFEWAEADAVKNDPDARRDSRIITNQGDVPIDENYNREIALNRRGAYNASLVYPSDEYLDLFNRETDLRCEYLLFEYLGYKTTDGDKTYDDGRKIQSFQDEKIAVTAGYTFPEILLMRAEGYARTGKADKALADLNYLRKFRHRTGTPALEISGADNVMMEIANERRRELSVGSYKRFADLKRYTNDAGKPWSKTEISHTVNGQTHTAKIDSEYFILPIRNDVLRWNPQWGIPMDESPWSNVKK